MSAMREELHHLVDELPEERLGPVLELIRGDAAAGRKAGAAAMLGRVQERSCQLSWLSAAARTGSAGQYLPDGRADDDARGREQVAGIVDDRLCVHDRDP